MSRQICLYPNTFQVIPSLKVILKRFHVYDLLIRGSTQEALKYYNKAFENVSHIKAFSPIINYFNFIFKYTNVSFKLLRIYYIAFKNEFYNYYENQTLEAVNSSVDIFLCKIKGFTLGPCIPTDIIGETSLFNIEIDFKIKVGLYNGIDAIDLFKEIDILSDKNKYYYKENAFSRSYLKAFDFLSDLLQTKYSENVFDSCLNRIEEKNNNNYDRTISSSNLLDFNSLQKKSLLIIKQYELHKHKELSIKDLIGMSDLASNGLFKMIILGTNYRRMLKQSYINENSKRSINKFSKDYSFINYTKAHSFLSKFSPKFIKKEGLDKMIVRRFKKCLLMSKEMYLMIKIQMKMLKIVNMIHLIIITVHLF